MSISDERTDTDKKGDEVKVYDVIINKKFYEKVTNSPLIRNFFLNVVFEALKDKFNVDLDENAVVLKNKKVFGELQHHKIYKKDMERIKKEYERPFIKDVTGHSKIEESTEMRSEKPLIQEISSTYNDREIFKKEVPEFRLFKKKDEDSLVYFEASLPKIVSFAIKKK